MYFSFTLTQWTTGRLKPECSSNFKRLTALIFAYGACVGQSVGRTIDRSIDQWRLVWGLLSAHSFVFFVFCYLLDSVGKQFYGDTEADMGKSCFWCEAKGCLLTFSPIDVKEKVHWFHTWFACTLYLFFDKTTVGDDVNYIW